MSCVSLATPGTEACAAVGGALGPLWRKWPATDYWANLVRVGSLAKAVCNIYITSELPITRAESCDNA
jgi:hypothetical protein